MEIQRPQCSGHRSGFFMCSLQLMTLAKLRVSAFNFLKLTVSYSYVCTVEIQRPQSSGHRSSFFMCSLQLMTLAKLRVSAFNFLKLTVSYSNVLWRYSAHKVQVIVQVSLCAVYN